MKWPKKKIVLTLVITIYYCLSYLMGQQVGQGFTHGVASGDPSHQSLYLWTRYVPMDRNKKSISWEVAANPSFSKVLQKGSQVANQNQDFCIKFRVSNLQPGTKYFYRFFVGSDTSVVGRTQTLPETTERVRIGVVNCAKYTGGYYHAYEELAKMEVDVVIHLGDYIYENGPSVPGSSYWAAFLSTGRQHDPPFECHSLQDYRTRYAQYRSDTSLQKLHARFPMITIWDDHEIAMKPLKKQKNGTLAYNGNWEGRFRNSVQAYHEWLPIGVAPFDPIYRSFQFGRLVNLMMLDTRVCCKDQVIKTQASLQDTSRHIIGNEQLAWIKKEITNYQATWNIFGNQLLMAHKDKDWERWPGFPHDRKRLLDFIRENNHLNYLVTTGNAHNPHHYVILDEKRQDTILHEFLPGAISSGNKAEKSNFDEKALANHAKKLEATGNVKWYHLDAHPFIVLDITTDTLEATWYNVSTIREKEYTVEEIYRYRLSGK